MILRDMLIAAGLVGGPVAVLLAIKIGIEWHYNRKLRRIQNLVQQNEDQIAQLMRELEEIVEECMAKEKL